MRQLIIFMALLPAILVAGVITTHRLGGAAAQKSGLAGNGITDIAADNGHLWLGTGNGLSRLDLATNEFTSYAQAAGLGHGSVAALWVHGDTLIVATATDTVTKVDPAALPKGTGISFSFDGGTTWRHVAQPGATPIQNLTYDIAVVANTVWIVCYGGGVLKSEDWGQSWSEAPPDTFNFDPYGRYNHRGFSATAGGGTLWIGTAEGINKSTDNGATWTNFNHVSQPEPISGNFVVGLGLQQTGGREIIWGATWTAEGEGEYNAVSFSQDGGLTWSTVLRDEKAHNFAFDDSVVYVATDNGLYVSFDLGERWYLYPVMRDAQDGDRVLSTEAYSAFARDGVLWAGMADGLARTADNGFTWDIQRAFVRTGQGGEARTYAYPNPFSPMRQNLLGGDGYIRFQYNTRAATRVTVKVFDFAMDLVATVVQDAYRIGPADCAELWNGRNDYGDLVANGAYFYSVAIEGDGTYWGKVLVVN
ncbi:MAG TPA: hypothetical protein PKI62_00570 [bacterium]|nr:hypothetical protein [bacterium]HPR88789.1 hypothetical protein [bacterium]